MTKLDPFHYPIPRKLANDPELGPWARYIHKYLLQSWLKLGGSNDAIADQDIAELYPWNSAEAETLLSFVDRFIHQNPDTREQFTASTNHTCYGPEIIEATGAITITLNSEPDAWENVTIKRNTTAGNVIVDGNGKNIDGASTYTMALNYEAIDLMYSENSGGWLIV